MKNFINGRGTGKTKQLIEYAAENNATIVCECPDRMLGKIHGYGKSGLRVISYSEYTNERNEKGPYVIDEVESFLKSEYPDTIGFTAIV